MRHEFEGRRLEGEVIPWAVRRHCRYGMRPPLREARERCRARPTEGSGALRHVVPRPRRLAARHLLAHRRSGRAGRAGDQAAVGSRRPRRVPGWPRLAPYRIGLEAGGASSRPCAEPRRLGRAAICVDARHAAAAAGALQVGLRNKTDRNDARGLAQLVRLDAFREAWLESPESHRRGRLLTARGTLRARRAAIENTIRPLLRTGGIAFPTRGTRSTEHALERIGDTPALLATVRPPLEARTTIVRRSLVLGRRIIETARRDEALPAADDGPWRRATCGGGLRGPASMTRRGSRARAPSAPIPASRPGATARARSTMRAGAARWAMPACGDSRTWPPTP